MGSTLSAIPSPFQPKLPASLHRGVSNYLDQEQSHTHMIPAISLDNFSNARQRPDSIKIDVEGHEEQVLLGARQVLTTTRRLVVEVHSQKLEERCRQLLNKSGFRIVKQGSLMFCDKSPEP
jgi:hypothetical protein